MANIRSHGYAKSQQSLITYPSGLFVVAEMKSSQSFVSIGFKKNYNLKRQKLAVVILIKQFLIKSL